MKSGMDIPELKEKIEKLRARKLELESLISLAQSGRRYTAEEIEAELRKMADEFDPEDIRRSVERFTEKIYADVDGVCNVHIGVHIDGRGGHFRCYFRREHPARTKRKESERE